MTGLVHAYEVACEGGHRSGIGRAGGRTERPSPRRNVPRWTRLGACLDFLPQVNLGAQDSQSVSSNESMTVLEHELVREIDRTNSNGV